MLNENGLLYIDVGNFWKYLGASAAIVFGAYEIYFRIGVFDGTKRIVEGVVTIADVIIAAFV